MPYKVNKIIACLICLSLLFQQTGFAQVAGELDLSGYFKGLGSTFAVDKFRPLHLRYLSYDNLNNNFRLLLDKGDFEKGLSPKGTVPLEEATKTLLNYFFVGISLPNSSFWVNLRPDSPDNIIDDWLAQTDVGKILLEADLQLKKDTAQFTSPQTPEGKKYWTQLYKKAEELLGYENITIPTLTRPWIVPGEIIIRETKDNAYIYKATLKVMLEQDYLKDSTTYNFSDPRLKALNEYSSQLIRELIIPKLTKEVNTSKRYAPLRQVYYSLILAQWFKARFYGKGGLYSWLIDKQNLTGLTSKDNWSKNTYFQAYQTSFKDGEYNLKEPISTPFGQSVRSYFSGGIMLVPEGGIPASPSAASPVTVKGSSTAIFSSRRGETPFTTSPLIASVTITGGANTQDPYGVAVTPQRESQIVSSPLGQQQPVDKVMENAKIFLLGKGLVRGADYERLDAFPRIVKGLLERKNGDLVLIFGNGGGKVKDQIEALRLRIVFRGLQVAYHASSNGVDFLNNLKNVEDIATRLINKLELRDGAIEIEFEEWLSRGLIDIHTNSPGLVGIGPGRKIDGLEDATSLPDLAKGPIGPNAEIDLIRVVEAKINTYRDDQNRRNRYQNKQEMSSAEVEDWRNFLRIFLNGKIKSSLGLTVGVPAGMGSRNRLPLGASVGSAIFGQAASSPLGQGSAPTQTPTSFGLGVGRAGGISAIVAQYLPGAYRKHVINSLFNEKVGIKEKIQKVELLPDDETICIITTPQNYKVIVSKWWHIAIEDPNGRQERISERYEGIEAVRRLVSISAEYQLKDKPDIFRSIEQQLEAQVANKTLGEYERVMLSVHFAQMISNGYQGRDVIDLLVAAITNIYPHSDTQLSLFIGALEEVLTKGNVRQLTEREVGILLGTLDKINSDAMLLSLFIALNKTSFWSQAGPQQIDTLIKVLAKTQAQPKNDRVIYLIDTLLSFLSGSDIRFTPEQIESLVKVIDAILVEHSQMTSRFQNILSRAVQRNPAVVDKILSLAREAQGITKKCLANTLSHGFVVSRSKIAGMIGIALGLTSDTIQKLSSIKVTEVSYFIHYALGVDSLESRIGEALAGLLKESDEESYSKSIDFLRNHKDEIDDVFSYLYEKGIMPSSAFLKSFLKKRDTSLLDILMVLTDDSIFSYAAGLSSQIKNILGADRRYEVTKEAVRCLVEIGIIVKGAPLSYEHLSKTVDSILQAHKAREIGDKKLLTELGRVNQQVKGESLKKIIQRELSEGEKEFLNHPSLNRYTANLIGLYFYLQKDYPQICEKVAIALSKLLEIKDIDKFNEWLFKEAEWNKPIYKELINSGYSPLFWDRGVRETLPDEGALKNIEEEMKKQTEQLIELAEKHNIIEPGSQYRLEGLSSYKVAEDFVTKYFFNNENVPQELKESVRAILEDTKKYEERYKNKVLASKKLTVKIVKDFLEDTYSGVGIPGCFAPSGSNSQMPVFHALETNALFLRVYDENNKMIANAVLVLTPQGVVVEPLYNASNLELTRVVFEGLAELLLNNMVPSVLLMTQDTYKYGQQKKTIAIKTNTLNAVPHFDFYETNSSDKTTFEMGYSLTRDDLLSKGFKPFPEVIVEKETTARDIALSKPLSKEEKTRITKELFILGLNELDLGPILKNIEKIIFEWDEKKIGETVSSLKSRSPPQRGISEEEEGKLKDKLLEIRSKIQQERLEKISLEQAESAPDVAPEEVIVPLIVPPVVAPLAAFQPTAASPLESQPPAAAASPAGKIKLGTARQPTLEERVARVNERLARPTERGTGWLRIAATPQEAFEFHKGWSSQATGFYYAQIADNKLVFPIRAWEKMAAWSNKSRDFERKSYFIARKINNSYEILDFIPLGSFAADPAGRVDDPAVTQISDYISKSNGLGIEEDVFEALGIDLTKQDELSFLNLTKGQADLVSIGFHSHHEGSAYYESPSESDRRATGESFAFVYSVKSAKGFLYNKETSVEIKQEPPAAASPVEAVSSPLAAGEREGMSRRELLLGVLGAAGTLAVNRLAAGTVANVIPLSEDYSYLFRPLEEKEFEEFVKQGVWGEIFGGWSYENYSEEYKASTSFRERALRAIGELTKDDKLGEPLRNLLKTLPAVRIVFVDTLPPEFVGGAEQALGIVVIDRSEFMGLENPKTFQSELAHRLIHELLHIVHPGWDHVSIYNEALNMIKPIQSFNQKTYNRWRFLTDLAMVDKSQPPDYFYRLNANSRELLSPLTISTERLEEKSHRQDIVYEGLSLIPKKLFFRIGEERYQVELDDSNNIIKVASGGSIQATTIAVSSSSAVEVPSDKGGIDLRALPIVTQPVAASALTLNPLLLTLQNINLREEWAEIERMLKADIVPSTQRLKEYLEVCCSRQDDMAPEIDKVLNCIADILRLEEERVSLTDSSLRDILVLLESDKSAQELQVALSSIAVAAKEPVTKP